MRCSSESAALAREVYSRTQSLRASCAHAHAPPSAKALLAALGLKRPWEVALTAELDASCGVTPLGGCPLLNAATFATQAALGYAPAQRLYMEAMLQRYGRALDQSRNFLRRCFAPIGNAAHACGEGELMAHRNADGSAASVPEQRFVLRVPIAESRVMAPLLIPPGVRTAFTTLLRCVHALLQECHIAYHATGGTLLGAERHGGMIPWDDDLDVAISAADEAALLAAFDFPVGQRRVSLPSATADAPAQSFTLALEHAPLIGYKIYLVEETEQLFRRWAHCDGTEDGGAESSAALASSSAGVHALFGIFVDLFVLSPDNAAGAVGGGGDSGLPPRREVLRNPCARAEWPHEWWPSSDSSVTIGERQRQRRRRLLPFNNAEALVCAPPKRDAEEYLQRTYGRNCLQVGVVPRSLHGRELPFSIEITSDLWGSAK